MPVIRNILGGFLFSGDDVYKHVRVLSGGERTRLAVARMLLRPSNTLLLDEPTNHLDLDSKEVLLDALVDYGGTLIFVSHDRYFVERLATKIIEIGSGTAIVYPGHLQGVPLAQGASARTKPRRPEGRTGRTAEARTQRRPDGERQRESAAAASRRARRGADSRRSRRRSRHATRRSAPTPRRASSSAPTRRAQTRIDELEARIAECEAAIREIEQTMAAPGFYDDRAGRAAGHRPPSGPDVAGRRPDAPVGRAPVRHRPRRPKPDRIVSRLQFCYTSRRTSSSANRLISRGFLRP